MTEIVAAHLERVAKLAEQLKLIPVCEYETFLAAALAACAREARLDEARWWAQHQSDLAGIERIEALERAAGEKA